jgi:hypothetical protein
MADQTFIAITVAGENTGNPAPGTENIKTLEEAKAWLDVNQEYIENQDKSLGHDFRSKYVLLAD